MRNSSLFIFVMFWPFLLGAEPLRFGLDSAKSLLYFEGHTPLHSFQGKAKAVHGEIQGEANDLAGIKGTLEFPVDSLSTGVGMRDRDMRGRYLESVRYPQIAFSMNGLSLSDSGRYEVRGTLAIHGVIRPLRVPVTFSPNPDTSSLYARGRFTVLLSDFGLERPGFLFNVMRDKVDIGFSLLWLRQP
jgi:polyisoprenoid-binding protein YceI